MLELSGPDIALLKRRALGWPQRPRILRKPEIDVGSSLGYKGYKVIGGLGVDVYEY